MAGAREEWRVRPVDLASVGELASVLSVHEVTARCLAGRGIIERAAALRFLEPRLRELRPPVGLAGLERAVVRLTSAVRCGERVGIFGDYDVDGATTAALLASYLGDAGAAVDARVARRDAGYGFGPADADAFADAGCTLIVTGDCGTSDLDALRRARARGVDTIVVDHHTVPAVDASEPHPAFALINPYCVDSTFPFRGLASVGLAFYVMGAVRTALRAIGHFQTRREPELLALLDLVALGTVADLVPLTLENRILVADGLRRLSHRPRPGLAALLRVAGVLEGERIDARTIAWKLAPRLNAPGRVGDAQPSLDLLLCRDPIAAEAGARHLDELNLQRRGLQDQVLAEVEAQLGAADPGPAVVVWGEGWSSGVVGIVAAKLVDRYRRPAFVVAVDPATGQGRGSARTSAGIHLYNALADCRDHLLRFGGHAAAAGFTVAIESLPSLRGALAGSVLRASGKSARLAELDADAEVELAEVDERLATELGELAPFGKENEEPILLSRRVRVASSRRVGDGSHLKLSLLAGDREIPAIGFGLGDRDPGCGADIDIAYHAGFKTWRGVRQVELTLRDLRS